MRLASDSRHEIPYQFNSRRILLPILIGLLLVAYLIFQDVTTHGVDFKTALQHLQWQGKTWFWLALAVAMVVLRDLAYMVQLRILTDGHLPWRSVIEVILLWDFFAAVSPSVMGGAAVAVYMLIKEKLTVGRSTAIVFTTVLLDEIFYLSMLPLGLWIVGKEAVFAGLADMQSDLISVGLMTIFWLAYGAIFVYVLFLGASLFVWPNVMNRLLRILFMFRIFKRWRRWGLRTARDLLITSVELRDKPKNFWWKLWGITAVAWFARYMVLNCILAAFSRMPMGLYEHVLAIARQAALFIIMVISPTPGSSGVAEAGFTLMFSDMAPLGLVLPMALFWRTISYYPYLFIGVPVLSRWVKRVYREA